MTLREELAAFYRRCGFSDTADRQACTVPVYTGCLLVPLPNIETRHVYLKYHDLHHVATGYSTGRIGEGEPQVFAPAVGAGDRSPGEAVLEVARTGHVTSRDPLPREDDALEGAATHVVGQAATDDLDLGQLRHVRPAGRP